MTPSGVSADRELVEAAQQGDEAALSRLVADTQGKVFNFVSRLVPPGDAQDVTQEVLLEMVRSLHGFRGESGWMTWVFRLATSKIADYFRRRGKHQMVSFDAAPDAGEPSWEVPDVSPGPLEQLEVREREALVERVFGGLPEAYRAALLLRVHEGLSYQDIAGALGCPVGTVKSRIHYGMVLVGRGIGAALAGSGRGGVS